MIFEVNSNKGELYLVVGRDKYMPLQDGDKLYYDKETDTITMVNYQSRFKFNKDVTWHWMRVGVKNPKFVHGMSQYKSGLDYVSKTMIDDITKRIYRDLKLKQLIG